MKTSALFPFRRLGLTALAAGVLAAHAPQARAALAVTDQSNPVQNTEFEVIGTSSPQVNPFGQSFTPALAGMNAATFYLSPSGSATVTLNVYAGAGFGGTLLGTSAPVTFTNTGFTNIEFDLPSVLIFIPGNIYTLGLTDGANSTFLGFTSRYTYAGGDLYYNGVASPPYDLDFAEGVTSASLLVPEPSTLVPVGVGLGGLGIAALRRRVRRA